MQFSCSNNSPYFCNPTPKCLLGKAHTHQMFRSSWAFRRDVFVAWVMLCSPHQNACVPLDDRVPAIPNCLAPGARIHGETRGWDPWLFFRSCTNTLLCVVHGWFASLSQDSRFPRAPWGGALETKGLVIRHGVKGRSHRCSLRQSGATLVFMQYMNECISSSEWVQKSFRLG